MRTIISDLCDWGFDFLDSGLPIEQLPAALSERTEQVLLHARRRWKLMLVTLMVTAGSGQRYMPRTRPGVTRFGASTVSTPVWDIKDFVVLPMSNKPQILTLMTSATSTERWATRRFLRFSRRTP